MSLYEIHEAMSPYAKERGARWVAWDSILLPKVLGSYLLESRYIVLLRCYIRKAFALSISGRGGRLGKGEGGLYGMETRRGVALGGVRGIRSFTSFMGKEVWSWLFNSLLYLRCTTIAVIRFQVCRLYYYFSCCDIFCLRWRCGCGLSCLMLDIWPHVAQYETDIRVQCLDVGVHVQSIV